MASTVSRAEISRYAHLRARVLDNAPVLHGASPRVIHHGYSVITTRHEGDQFQVALIAYSGPNGSTVGTLLRKSRVQSSLWAAMEELLADMERDLAVKLKGAIPGGKVGHCHDVEDGDQTPKASPNGEIKPEYGGVFASHCSTSIPRKALPRPPSPTPAMPEALYDRFSSHNSTMQYLRSQGFPALASPVSPVANTSNQNRIESKRSGTGLFAAEQDLRKWCGAELHRLSRQPPTAKPVQSHRPT